MVSKRARSKNSLGTRLNALQEGMQAIENKNRTPAPDDKDARIARLEEMVEQLASPNFRAQQEAAIWDGRYAVPAGVVITWAGDTVPLGWLECDGSAISRTGYPELYAAIGTQYGAGNGSTTFNLPNYRGRVLVGLDPAQTEFDAMGEAGGAKTHTLTIAEMPAHNHQQTIGGIDDSNWTHGAGQNPPADGAGTFLNGSYTQNEGGGGAHNNLQPYRVVKYLISVGAASLAVGTPPSFSSGIGVVVGGSGTPLDPYRPNLDTHWAALVGATQSSSGTAYKNNWWKGQSGGTSISYGTGGFTINATGVYEVRAMQRSTNTAGNNYLAISLNGDRTALETRASGIWTHGHGVGTNAFATSEYMGVLNAGELICAGPPVYNTPDMTYGNTTTSGAFYIKRLS